MRSHQIFVPIKSNHAHAHVHIRILPAGFCSVQVALKCAAQHLHYSTMVGGIFGESGNCDQQEDLLHCANSCYIGVPLSISDFWSSPDAPLGQSSAVYCMQYQVGTSDDHKVTKLFLHVRAWTSISSTHKAIVYASNFIMLWRVLQSWTSILCHKWLFILILSYSCPLLNALEQGSMMRLRLPLKCFESTKTIPEHHRRNWQE